MAKLVPLEQAAEMLQITPEKLTELISKKKIFGYRDGATWKFKEQEIERVANELGVEQVAVEESGVDLLGPDAGTVASLDIDADLEELVDVTEIDLDDKEDTDGPDSVLISELELGGSDPSISSTIIGKESVNEPDADLDLNLANEESSEELVLDLSDNADPSGLGSDLKIAPSDSAIDGDAAVKIADSAELDLDGSGELRLEDSAKLTLDAGSPAAADSDDLPLIDDSAISISEPDTAAGESSLVLGDEPPSGDSPTSASDLLLSPDQSNASGLSLQADSNAGLKPVDESDDLILDADDDEIVLESDDSFDLEGASDLVLEGGSELDLGGSSINLDGSGTGTGIGLDGLDSSVNITAGDSGINVGSPSDSGISLEQTPDELALGSGIEALELGDAGDLEIGEEGIGLDEPTLVGDDDFLLTPVESADPDDADSGSQVIALDTDDIEPADNADLLDLDDAESDQGLEIVEEGVEEVAPLSEARGVAVAAEDGYTIGTVTGLGLCTLMLALSGMMVTDLIRNMWSWSGTYSLNSSLMNAIIGIFGK